MSWQEVLRDAPWFIDALSMGLFRSLLGMYVNARLTHQFGLRGRVGGPNFLCDASSRILAVAHLECLSAHTVCVAF